MVIDCSTLDPRRLLDMTQEILLPTGAPRYYVNFGTLRMLQTFDDPMKTRVTYRNTPYGLNVFPLTVDFIEDVQDTLIAMHKREGSGLYAGAIFSTIYSQFIVAPMNLIEAIEPDSMWTNLRITERSIRHDYVDPKHVSQVRKAWQLMQSTLFSNEDMINLVNEHIPQGTGTDRYELGPPSKHSIAWTEALKARGITSIITQSGWPLHNVEMNQGVFLTRSSFRVIGTYPSDCLMYAWRSARDWRKEKGLGDEDDPEVAMPSFVPFARSSDHRPALAPSPSDLPMTDEERVAFKQKTGIGISVELVDKQLRFFIRGPRKSFVAGPFNSLKEADLALAKLL